MPHQLINGARLHYTDTGGDHEVVLMAHGLAWSGRMFAAQTAALRGSYRCVSVDFRGQGQSEVTEDGYGLDQLSDDLIGLMEALNLKQVHFIGLSMGGFVGMRLAARRPELIRSLVLLNTSARSESSRQRLKYHSLSLMVRCCGIRAVAPAAMRIMFGKTFLRDASRTGEREHWRSELGTNHRVGIRLALHGVVSRPPILSELGRIVAPTLVVVGEEDIATPPECGQEICESISQAKIERIPRCGHSSTIEQPDVINDLLLEFFESTEIRFLKTNQPEGI